MLTPEGFPKEARPETAATWALRRDGEVSLQRGSPCQSTDGRSRLAHLED